MPDREKVVKGLYDLRRYLEDKEWSDNRVDRQAAKVYWQTVTDAISLLKEQETDKKDAEYMPREVIPVTIGNDYRTWLCSNCGSKLQYGKELICPKCHKKIDWEGR